MADRLTTQILDALSRAARAPAGDPLITRRGSPGLFPATALGRSAAQRACDEGWLAPAGDDRHQITERGRAYLLEQSSPRQVLEDVARAVEARGEQVAGLIESARDLRTELAGLRSLVADMAQRLGTDEGRAATAQRIRRLVADWPTPSDCPLPELYQRLRADQPTLSIGSFHDLLRRMHTDETIYLHPWTGPLYRLPEPALALLVGHEVAYYASLRVAPAEEPGDDSSAARSRWPAPAFS